MTPARGLICKGSDEAAVFLINNYIQLGAWRMLDSPFTAYRVCSVDPLPGLNPHIDVELSTNAHWPHSRIYPRRCLTPDLTKSGHHLQITYRKRCPDALMVLVPSWDHVIWATLGNTGHHYNVAFHPMTPRVSHPPASLTNTGPCRDIRSCWATRSLGPSPHLPRVLEPLSGYPGRCS